MQAHRATIIEKNVDRAAAALFAIAAGYAAYEWFSRGAGQPVLGAETAAAAVAGFWLSLRALGAVQPAARKLAVPVFDLRDIDPLESEELLLTETCVGELLLTDRHEPADSGSEEPLVLDDILAELGPDSRVVRLFDPAAMPTPGQLNDRIERHLVRDPPPAAYHDASQALHEALAELRRSLR